MAYHSLVTSAPDGLVAQPVYTFSPWFSREDLSECSALAMLDLASSLANSVAFVDISRLCANGGEL